MIPLLSGRGIMQLVLSSGIVASYITFGLQSIHSYVSSGVFTRIIDQAGNDKTARNRRGIKKLNIIY